MPILTDEEEEAEGADATRDPWLDAVEKALAELEATDEGRARAEDVLFRAVPERLTTPGEATVLTAPGGPNAFVYGLMGRERITDRPRPGGFVAAVWVDGRVTVARILRFDAGGQNDYVIVDRMTPGVPLLV